MVVPDGSAVMPAASRLAVGAVVCFLVLSGGATASAGTVASSGAGTGSPLTGTAGSVVVCEQGQPLASDGLYFQGQQLEFQATDDAAGETYQLRESDETSDGGQEPGSFVARLQLDGSARGTVDTSNIGGLYVVVDENGDPVEFDLTGQQVGTNTESNSSDRHDFEVQPQTLSARFDDSEVQQGDWTTFEVQSNDAEYTVTIESGGLDTETLETVFGVDDACPDRNGVQVEIGSTDRTLTPNFSTVSPGDYTVETAVVSTDASSRDSISVTEADSGDTSGGSGGSTDGGSTDDGSTDGPTTGGETPTDQPPSADISVSKETVDVGQPVTLDATGSTDDNGIAEYEWYLDPDSSSVDAHAQRVTWSYDRPQMVSFTLAVTDTAGQTDRVTHRIRVVEPNDDPQPRLSLSTTTPQAGANVTFSANQSSDDGTIEAYEWDVGADGTVDGTGTTFTTSFADDGDREVLLRVTDDDGVTATTRRTVAVENPAPTPAFGHSPARPEVGETVTVDAANASDDGSITAYRWDVGADGTVDATGPSVRWTVSETGPVPVTLTVTDDDGATARQTRTLDATAQPAPTAAFGVRPTTPRPDEPATLDASNATDDDGIAAYRWDVGADGTVDATGESVDYTFPENGAYTVALTVTDADGANATTRRTVAVNAPPTPGFEARGQVRAEGAVTLVASNTTDDSGVQRYEWDLDGDGTYERQGRTVTFRPQRAGVSTVGLRVVDDDGAVATAERSFQVAPPERGFLTNGSDSPLSFVDSLSLTVVGFLLSVVGIVHQLLRQ